MRFLLAWPDASAGCISHNMYGRMISVLNLGGHYCLMGTALLVPTLLTNAALAPQRSAPAGV